VSNISLKNLKKVYKTGKNQSFEAVKSINLEIKDKEFIVLVGPSGCGKSTTLRMIAGLEDITEGEILIDDLVVNDIEPKNRDIAMVFQNYALYPHMTVFENMAFALQMRKVSKEEIKQKVSEVAQILDLTNELKRKPKELSGGQKQRVAIGRAMVRNPKAFLMDEPLSNLDAKLRVQMRSELSKLHRDLQTTFIYVTHDQIEAMTLATRIVVMNNGKIMQEDTPDRLFNMPANLFVAEFIGSPQMNFIDGFCVAENNAVYFQNETLKIRIENTLFNMTPKQDQKIILGIRPEHLVLAEDHEQNEETLPCQVQIIENMGSAKNIYCEFMGKTIIMKTESEKNFTEGSLLHLKMLKNKIHLFHEESGDSLYYTK